MSSDCSTDLATPPLNYDSSDDTDCCLTKSGRGEFETIDQRGSNRPIFRYLNRYVVTPIAPNWYNVGLELLKAEEEDELQLDAIKANHEPCEKARATKMLKFWLQKKTDASWNDLIETLRVPTIGLCTLALEIEKMLIPEEINTFVDVTSDVLGSEELIMDNYQQQMSKDDTPQETTQLGLSRQSQMLVNIMPPQRMNMSDITRSVDNASSYLEGMKRNPLPTDPFIAESAATTSITTSKSASHLQTVTNTKIKENKCSERVCEAVSEYYRGQFVDRWRFKTDSSTINNLAALLVERDDSMKVVVFTAGTTKKGECSYTLNKGSADECMWGHCDGHAVSLCYRFASFYLITEMYRHKKNSVMSILEIQPGGYELKKGIKLHFFSTNIPCGFMNNEDCYFLSWKIPFKGKPHCLKCSSLILIDAYLGIQGPLSHLFNKPVYVSSITISTCEDGAVLKAAKIKGCFERFNLLLNSTNETAINNYKFHIPHVAIAEFKPGTLFSVCFKPFNRNISHIDASQTIENQTEEMQAAGAVPDAEGNLGTHMIVFALNNGIGTVEFCKKMTLQLENATNNFSNYIKVLQQRALIAAQKRLSSALNVSKALKLLKNSISKKIEERFTTHCQSATEVVVQLKEMEQCRSITDEVVTTQVNKLKDLPCTIMKRFENDCSMQAPIASVTSLSESAKQIESNSRLMVETLDSLNRSIKEFENGTKSLVDELTGYNTYKQALDDLDKLLEKSNSSSCDPQFYLDLMGCDWGRSLGAIHHDIQKGVYGTAHPPTLAVEDQQLRQLSSINENHVLNNTKQESQIRMAAEQELQTGMVKPKEAFSGSRSPCVVTGCYGSSHHIPDLPPLTEHEDQQQYNLENDNVFDKDHENEVQKETHTETYSGFTDIVTCTGSCGLMHQVCSSSSSPQDEDQQQQAIKSKLVIGSSGERKDTKQIQQPQNHAAIQEEDQHVTHLDSVFGCDLTELVNAEGGVVPKFLIKCMEQIEKRGLMISGIYHLSGSAEQITTLQQRIDQDLPVDFADQEWGDIHIISGALKLFLKELPNSLIPFSWYNKLTNAGKLKPPHNIAKLKLYIIELPMENYQTVKRLFDHLRKVMKYSSVNKMQSANLATVFGPLIPIHSKVMEAFLNDYDIIFGQF